MRQFKPTRSFTESLGLYGGTHAILSPSEEIDLCRRAKSGDRGARDKLVTHNLRFVVSVAKGYRNQGLELEDLISEGNIGLMKAVDRFDETKGFKFLSYAVFWVRQSILEALERDGNLIKYPSTHRDDVRKYLRAKESLEQKLGRDVTPEDLSAIIDGVEDIAERNQRVRSTDAPVDDEFSLGDMIASPPVEERGSMRRDVRDSIRRLRKRERTIIKAYFGLGEDAKTLDDIAQELSLHRGRVIQIKNKSLNLLRANSDRLREHL